MDKNAIKKYAVWARRELISRVTQRALKYGISEKEIISAKETSIHSVALSPTEIAQRTALISQISNKRFEQVMEEVAYTWFNRFSALRFMEVNGYLPTHVRVFTDDENNFKPQIMTEAINLELDGLDMEKVYAMKDANDNDALFKYLIITQCNALSSILPGMFQKIDDYTELLFPDNLLREGSAVEQMIVCIPEGDWKDQVQIIGWLYQYYNTEVNELVYDGNMSKSRIAKDLLPAATTIYTPDWVVHYMVENSLGRFWLEGHPNDEIKKSWKYYLEEAKQEPEVQAHLAEIRKEYAALKPENIRVIDPCSGSGHICVVLFDVLISIYLSYGYGVRDAVKSIIENNVYGLDIDERAAQLAYFAVMMKAVKYDSRFLRRKNVDGSPDVPQPHIYAICESNDLNKDAIEYFCNDRIELKEALRILIDELRDAKEYGSILNITQVDFASLYVRFDEIRNEINFNREYVLTELLSFVQCAEAIAQKYHVVVTNPPYLGSSRFSPALDKYVKDNYIDEKSDLSMVMLKKAMQNFVRENGFVSFVTTSSWMFLSSFEKVRTYMFSNLCISSLVDFGTELFDGKVGHNPIVAWVSRKTRLEYKMRAVRLVDYCYARRDEKEPEFFNIENHYTAAQCEFAKIPGSPVAYWLSKNAIKAFNIGTLAERTRASVGIQTGDNEKFVHNWWEIIYDDIFFTANCARDSFQEKKWFPYNKGGEYRKWSGNDYYVVQWKDDGECIKQNSELTGHHYQQYADELKFKSLITWSRITSGTPSFRYKTNGYLSDMAGFCLYSDKLDLKILTAFCNSTVTNHYLTVLAPTLNIMTGQVLALPFNNVIETDDRLKNGAERCINCVTEDWDSFEISWDFQRHPLVRQVSTVVEAYTAWQGECEERFNQLKSNEEELNRIFIDIYGLQNELTPEVEDKDVTVRRADLQREIKSLISYAVGCMFGRYSIYKEGLIFAGESYSLQAFVDKLNDKPYTVSKEDLVRAYRKEGVIINEMFYPDEDNIIPICDDEYFGDDIVNRFVDFIRNVYGEQFLEQNLKFIADVLGGKGQPKEAIRNYFLNDFYTDHLKIYQKRPIYWLFDSGKKNGFKCLIYMHRYQPDLVARIRTDYVHEQQSRYRTSIADLEKRVASASTSEKVKLSKQLSELQDQAAELHEYEEKIHHLADQYISIDLDDGVKVNYAKFQDVLAKIK